MSKRKAQEPAIDYNFLMLSQPRWLMYNVITTKWPSYASESATMVNTLQLQPDRSRWFIDESGDWVHWLPQDELYTPAAKVSHLIHALDLVHFEGYQIPVDVDLAFPPHMRDHQGVALMDLTWHA